MFLPESSQSCAKVLFLSFVHLLEHGQTDSNFWVRREINMGGKRGKWRTTGPYIWSQILKFHKTYFLT